MSTPLINWSNVTDLGQIPSKANEVTSGDFWMVMYFMIFIILILILMAWGWELALMSSGLVSLFIGFYLVYAELMDWTYVMVPAGVLLLMFFYVTWNSNQNSR